METVEDGASETPTEEISIRGLPNNASSQEVDKSTSTGRKMRARPQSGKMGRNEGSSNMVLFVEDDSARRAKRPDRILTEEEEKSDNGDSNAIRNDVL